MTVVYYTANREKESFERKVQQTILENMGESELISVSQKPIDFGKNICVGDVGVTGHNAWRQFQIGCQEATTKYVCAAEADGLYPPSYFAFRPARDDAFYVAMPLYALFAQRGKAKRYALKPRASEAAMIVSRALVLQRLEDLYRGLPQWRRDEEFLWLLKGCVRETAWLDAPIVTVKTDRNMHKKTPHDREHVAAVLPYWGDAHDVLLRYG